MLGCIYAKDGKQSPGEVQESVRLRSGAVCGSDSSSSTPMGITLSSKKVGQKRPTERNRHAVLNWTICALKTPLCMALC